MNTVTVLLDQFLGCGSKDYRNALVDATLELFSSSPAVDESGGCVSLYVLSLALNRNTNVALLEAFSSDTNSLLRSFTCLNSAVSSVLLRNVFDDEVSVVVLRSLAVNPSTPSDVLGSLAVGVKKVRCAVAGNPSTPVDVLRLLADDVKLMVVRSVAANPSTPVDVLVGFSTHSDVEVRACVAANSSVPVDVLTMLAFDESNFVRHGVANNLSSSPSTLNVLAVDSDRDVRWSVCCNDSVSFETLKLLLVDDDVQVRRLADERRVELLEVFIYTLPVQYRESALLLVPSFTGWPDDLAATVAVLSHTGW